MKKRAISTLVIVAAIVAHIFLSAGSGLVAAPKGDASDEKNAKQAVSAAVSGVASEEGEVVGKISKQEPTKKNRFETYEIVTEKKERFKLIGPKTIITQILSLPDYNSHAFRLVGKIYKKDGKRGILISKFEQIAAAPAPQPAPPVPEPAKATSEAQLKTPAAAPTMASPAESKKAPSTSEAAIEKK